MRRKNLFTVASLAVFASMTVAGTAAYAAPGLNLGEKRIDAAPTQEAPRSVLPEERPAAPVEPNQPKERPPAEQAPQTPHQQPPHSQLKPKQEPSEQPSQIRLEPKEQPSEQPAETTPPPKEQPKPQQEQLQESQPESSKPQPTAPVEKPADEKPKASVEKPAEPKTKVESSTPKQVPNNQVKTEKAPTSEATAAKQSKDEVVTAHSTTSADSGKKASEESGEGDDPAASNRKSETKEKPKTENGGKLAKTGAETVPLLLISLGLTGMAGTLVARFGFNRVPA